ncbi:MAG: N-acetyltransferase [Aquificota bacterium]|nr:MAG: N-acetyltransferase [Aquificota bacterium]
MKVEKATLKDAPQIHKLINSYAGEGFLLPRSLMDIYESIRDFFVIREGDRVVATAALKVVWEDLAEVRSVLVSDEFKGRGWGRALVEACIREARELGVKKVFVLTNSPGYFSRLGFRLVDKRKLPHKVWFDCLKCPKFPDCDEVAMMMVLEDPRLE